ncbi:hypothetical protein ADK99_03835, partial [Streptomyces sp. MMG1064]
VPAPNPATFNSGARSVLDGKGNGGEGYDTGERKPENATAGRGKPCTDTVRGPGDSVAISLGIHFLTAAMRAR